MTNNYTTIKSKNKYPELFGGLIYASDFGEYHSLEDVANRIIANEKFNNQCEIDAKFRDIRRQYNEGNSKVGNELAEKERVVNTDAL